MSKFLLMSALALGLCACGPGSDIGGAKLVVGPQAGGAAEQNNESCGETVYGVVACSNTH